MVRRTKGGSTLDGECFKKRRKEGRVWQVASFLLKGQSPSKQKSPKSSHFTGKIEAAELRYGVGQGKKNCSPIWVPAIERIWGVLMGEWKCPSQRPREREKKKKEKKREEERGKSYRNQEGTASESVDLKRCGSGGKKTKASYEKMPHEREEAGKRQSSGRGLLNRTKGEKWGREKKNRGRRNLGDRSCNRTLFVPANKGLLTDLEEEKMRTSLNGYIAGRGSKNWLGQVGREFKTKWGPRQHG